MTQVTVRTQREIFKGHIFSVVEEELTLPDGRDVTRAHVRHPGAAVIIPVLDNGDLLMVRQYRHALRATMLEFPAGTLEPGESPRECAEREVVEEVAHRARTLDELGILHPAPGFCNEKQICFLARGLVPEQGVLDEDEILTVERISPAALEQAIIRGEMTDAKTIACFTLYKLKAA